MRNTVWKVGVLVNECKVFYVSGMSEMPKRRSTKNCLGISMQTNGDVGIDIYSGIFSIRKRNCILVHRFQCHRPNEACVPIHLWHVTEAVLLFDWRRNTTKTIKLCADVHAYSDGGALCMHWTCSHVWIWLQSQCVYRTIRQPKSISELFNKMNVFWWQSLYTTQSFDFVLHAIHCMCVCVCVHPSYNPDTMQCRLQLSAIHALYRVWCLGKRNIGLHAENRFKGFQLSAAISCIYFTLCVCVIPALVASCSE